MNRFACLALAALQTVLRSFAAVSLLALTLACSGDSTAIALKASRLELQHASQTVVAGEQIAIQATAFDATNREVPVPPLEWSSDDPTIASVGVTGIVTGHGPGVAEIRATGGGLRGTINITVRPAPPAWMRIVVKSGTADVVVGQKTVLAAQFFDAAGKILPSDAPVSWTTRDYGVVVLEPIMGSPDQIEVTALSTGLARITAGVEGAQNGIIVGVVPERTEESHPIAGTNFLVAQIISSASALVYAPSLRLSVTPGRSLELVRIQLAVWASTGRAHYPPLCANSRLDTGQYDVLGTETYPANSIGFEPRLNDHLVNPDVAALLTYRADGGPPRMMVLRGTDNVWDYDYVFKTQVTWEICKS